MTFVNRNFINFDGSPVAGRVPTRVIEDNGVALNNDQRSVIESLYARFADECKLSISPTLARSFVIDGNVSVQMSSGYGVDTVRVSAVKIPNLAGTQAPPPVTTTPTEGPITRVVIEYTYSGADSLQTLDVEFGAVEPYGSFTPGLWRETSEGTMVFSEVSPKVGELDLLNSTSLVLGLYKYRMFIDYDPGVYRWWDELNVTQSTLSIRVTAYESMYDPLTDTTDYKLTGANVTAISQWAGDGTSGPEVTRTVSSGNVQNFIWLTPQQYSGVNEIGDASQGVELAVLIGLEVATRTIYIQSALAFS